MRRQADGRGFVTQGELFVAVSGLVRVARFVATTLRHVEGTPLDEVPIAGAAVDALLDTYSTDTHRAGAQAGAD